VLAMMIFEISMKAIGYSLLDADILTKKYDM